MGRDARSAHGSISSSGRAGGGECPTGRFPILSLSLSTPSGGTRIFRDTDETGIIRVKNTHRE